MKPNVDEVDLIAGQELATHPSPNKDGYIDYWPVGSLLGYKIKVETAGAIISELIGSGQVIPDRVYTIGGVMHGATVEVDSDPLSPTFGLPILKDTYLDGKEYSIFERGTEYLIKGVEWQNNVVGGGFSKLLTGAEWTDGQIYSLIFKPQFSSVIVTPDAVGRFTSGVQLITGDTPATDGMNRKLILIQGSTTAAVQFTLNPTYPENVVCAIRTGGGSNFQSVIKPPVGQFLLDGGTGLAKAVLGQQDYFQGVRIGTKWYILSRGERWKYVGQIVFGGVPGPDRIKAIGQKLAIADYPGLNDYLDDVIANYGSGAVVNAGTWATNRSKWGRDATDIYVKDTRGRYLRSLDLGANIDPRRSGVNSAFGLIPGDWKLGELLAHTHSYTKPKTFSNSDAGGVPDYVQVEGGVTGSTGGVENSVNDMAEPMYILI